MMRPVKRLFVSFFVALGLASPVPAEWIRLRDGSFFFGEVKAHDESGIRVLRYDTGGIVELRWDHLAPQESERLRTVFGYLSRAGEEVRIVADRLRLTDGREEIGILVEREDPQFFVLRNKENTIRVPKDRVVLPFEKVEVNALEVYTKDQLYEERRATIDPSSPADQLELARFLVRILDYARALVHYREVQRLDPSFHPGEVAAQIASCENLAKRQEEIDALAEIDRARGRKRFTEALALLDDFVERFPQSPLLGDVADRRRRTQARLEEEVRRETARRWYDEAGDVAYEKGFDRSFTHEQAMRFAEEEMSKEILARVTQAIARSLLPEATEDSIRAAWEARGPFARSQRASYGQGTFVLGREKALAGLVEEKEEAATDARSKEERELAERVRRYLEAIQAGRQGGAAEEDENAPANWWESVTAGTRRQWILAYYAEHGGDMEVVRVYGDTCRNCGGEGTIEVIALVGVSNEAAGPGGQGSQGSQTRSRKLCPDCHGLAVYRVVRFR
jgi:hypothetical protein